MKNLLSLIFILVTISSCSYTYDEGKISYDIWYGWDKAELPDFSSLGKPDMSGTADVFNIGGEECFDKDGYAAVFRTVMTIDKSSDIVFYLSSDDGARLYVDEALVIDRSDSHGGMSMGECHLSKGRHNIRVEYYECTDGQYLGLTLRIGNEVAHEYGSESYEDGVPDFVAVQAEETYKRYADWKGDDKVLLFPIFTDIHAHTRESFRHIGYVAQTDDLFDYDFMACLGDLGLDLGPSDIDKRHARIILEKTREEMRKYDGTFLYIPGNHDWDAGEGEYNTEVFFSDFFQKPMLEKANGNLHLTPEKVYCYYDVPEKDTRVILLNSSGTGTQNGSYYIFDDEQLDWLETLLESTDPETSVILMSHYMPHPLGRWHNEPAPITKVSNEKLMNLLSEYKTKRKIVGLFCGDSHFNVHAVRDGVNYYITQSYGYCTESQMMEGGKRAFFDFRESLCCDLIAVKPDKREVRTFRVGAGGQDMDYEFTY